MSLGKAIVLGIVQGLTEFLPISSSGHLVIIGHYLKVEFPGLTFTAFVHLGTLLAILLFFRQDIKEIFKWTVLGKKMLFFIMVGSIPTAIIGFVFQAKIEKLFTTVKPVGFMLLITGFLLWLAEKKKQNRNQLNILDAFLIGTMQGISLLPGISRSGATISLGLFRKLKREVALRYSFLLSVPAILGANFLVLSQQKPLVNVNIFAIIGGTIAAFMSGYFALSILLKVLYRRKLDIFAYYCWILGLIVLFLRR